MDKAKTGQGFPNSTEYLNFPMSASFRHLSILVFYSFVTNAIALRTEHFFTNKTLSSTDAADSTNRKDNVTRYFIFHALKSQHTLTLYRFKLCDLQVNYYEPEGQVKGKFLAGTSQDLFLSSWFVKWWTSVLFWKRKLYSTLLHSKQDLKEYQRAKVKQYPSTGPKITTE